MKIKEFVDAYNNKKFMNTKTGSDERSEYLKKELEIKEYVPFKTKREIAEMIVEQYTEVVDGIKKHDSISAYVGFVIAMIFAHTTLEFSNDPMTDYDLLAESGLLPLIVAEFQNDYNEGEVILKMELSMELEDNNVNVLIGHFLDSILKKLEGASEALNEKFKNINIKDILGADINIENMDELNSLINKLK